MNFKQTINEIESLQQHIEENKLNTQFERAKLYAYLGEELVDMFKRYNVIIAGGLVTSLFTNKDINDVDVYFRSQDDAIGLISELYEDTQFVVAHTKKATLFAIGEVSIQTIHFDYFRDVSDVFNAFDFTVCMGAYDFKNESFHLHKDFLKHNSQRLLKFNKDTAFPLISLLRVQKYEDKGYEISKPEMFRIAMTCMNLDINSYDELKEQLGGMYGVNYDKLFNDVEDEEFSLDNAIDKIQDLALDEDYFKKPVPVEFDSLEDLIESITGKSFTYFTHEEKNYRVFSNGKVKLVQGDIPDNSKEIDPKEYFDNLKLYKFVQQADSGDLYSFYDSNFKYEVGKTVSAKNSKGLFFNFMRDIYNSTYLDRDNKVLIEVSIDYADFIGEAYSSIAFDDSIQFKKCYVNRIVPKAEYENKLIEEEEADWDAPPF